MKILQLFAFSGLGLTIVPPFLHLFSTLSEGMTFNLMAAGMVVWYISAIPWLYYKNQKLDKSTQDYI